MSKKEVQAKIDFHLDRIKVLTSQAKLCRKLSNKLKILKWIKEHKRLAMELKKR